MSDQKIEWTEVELQRMALAQWIELPADLVRASEVEVARHMGFVRDTFAVRLKATLWSRHVGDHAVCYPADWWQAFKRRFFPAWALRRWPVLETTVVVTAWHDYPGLVIQNHEPRLRYRQRMEEAPR